jgi:hypothetical protein
MLELTRLLLASTEGGHVLWSPNVAVPGQFATELAGSLLSITPRDAEGSHPFVLALWGQGDSRSDGRPEETLLLEKLSTSDVIPGASEGWEQMLIRLWRLARTQALRIEERIDAVLAQLIADLGSGILAPNADVQGG